MARPALYPNPENCTQRGLDGAICAAVSPASVRRMQAIKRSKARVIKNGDHLRMNVTGMICPRTGEAFLLEFTHNDRDVFQAFLDEPNRLLKPQRPRNTLICDNASWHKCKSNTWGLFEPLFLPAYSPDFSPIEKLWLVIKAHWFSDFVAKTKEQLVARLDQALIRALNRKVQNQQTCSIGHFLCERL
jgi:transposase